jgi:hypothetical protein
MAIHLICPHFGKRKRSNIGKYTISRVHTYYVFPLLETPVKDVQAVIGTP